MKKLKYLKIILLFLGAFPLMTSAHVPSILNGGYWGGEDPSTGMSGIVSCSAPITVTQHPGESESDIFPPDVSQGQHPCTSLCDLIHTLIHLISLGESIALYAAAPILFAWGGILILISAGNPGRISEGKKILTGTLIGVLIILSAYLIVRTLIVTLDIGRFIPLGIDCSIK